MLLQLIPLNILRTQRCRPRQNTTTAHKIFRNLTKIQFCNDNCFVQNGPGLGWFSLISDFNSLFLTSFSNDFSLVPLLAKEDFYGFASTRAKDKCPRIKVGLPINGHNWIIFLEIHNEIFLMPIHLGFWAEEKELETKAMEVLWFMIRWFVEKQLWPMM